MRSAFERMMQPIWAKEDWKKTNRNGTLYLATFRDGSIRQYRAKNMGELFNKLTSQGIYNFVLSEA